MIRLLGAALILSGGAVQRWLILCGKRRERETIYELSIAFDALARELHSALVPLPRLLRQRGLGETADAFFSRVARSYAAGGGDQPLAKCWQDAVSELQLPSRDAKAVLEVAMAFGAQEDELVSAFHAAALTLRTSLAQRRSEQRQQERLVTTLCLSLSVLLTVLLL